VSPIRKITAVKIGGWVVLAALALIYAGGVILGATKTISLALVRVFEFIGLVGIPVAGGVFLLWFAYKMLLEPVIRQRKLDRIREYRARRDINVNTDPTDET
jgi:small neutral amino acid transporter SnatA (MarC family)